MAGAFPLAAAIERLVANVAAFKFVGNAADLRAALAATPSAVPAGYVCSEERGQTPAGASGGLLVQTVSVSLQVVLFVRNYAKGRSGGAARSDMDALGSAVDDALINWSPDTPYKPFWFTAGRDERYEAGTLVCQRIYASSYGIRKNRTA